MKFTPMSDLEIKEQMLLPDGTYYAKVVSAIDTDKNGNPLLTLKGVEKIDIELEIIDNNGKPRKIKAVLTSAFIKLLNHFCYAAELGKIYESGNLKASDCLGREVAVELSKKSFTGKDGQLIVTNNIIDFLPLKSSNVLIDKNFNDDVPF